jgi:hypothetical protein
LRLGLSQGLCNNRGSNNSWGNWGCLRFDWGNFNSVMWGSFMTLYGFLFGWINIVLWCGRDQREVLKGGGHCLGTSGTNRLVQTYRRSHEMVKWSGMMNVLISMLNRLNNWFNLLNSLNGLSQLNWFNSLNSVLNYLNCLNWLNRLLSIHDSSMQLYWLNWFYLLNRLNRLNILNWFYLLNRSHCLCTLNRYNRSVCVDVWRTSRRMNGSYNHHGVLRSFCCL